MKSEPFLDCAIAIALPRAFSPLHVVPSLDADPALLRELCNQSPVFDIVLNPVPVTVSVETVYEGFESFRVNDRALALLSWWGPCHRSNLVSLIFLSDIFSAKPFSIRILSGTRIEALLDKGFQPSLEF